MWKLVRQELKQFFSKGVVIFLVVLCLLGIGYSIVYQSGQSGMFDDIGLVKGRANYQLERERSKNYEGAINEAFLSEVFTWDQQTEQDNGISESFRFSDVYQKMRFLLEADEALGAEREDENTLEVPLTSFKYYYAPGWGFLLQTFSMWLMPLALCLLIILGTTPSFSSEYEANMDEIIGSMQYGRRKQAIAKWIASWIGQTIVLLSIFLCIMLVTFFMVGGSGGNASIQFHVREYPYLISIRSGVLLTILFLWLSMMLTGSITMFISRFTRNKIRTVVISGLILIVPPLLSVSNIPLLENIFNLLPLGHSWIGDISIMQGLWIVVLTMVVTLVCCCLTFSHRGSE